ncbi:MAG: cation transporter [Coriobacteriales bacterium]|nr:cation transporter [Coriobacteriales bacterium]
MITTTMGVDGMMCNMCEAHVQDAIRKAANVKRVKANRRKGNCVVDSEQPLDEEAMRAALSEWGYELTSFEQTEAKKRGLFGLR